MEKNNSDLTPALLDWFAQNQRALPWRTDYEPYAIWVSEMMLQQTQMERGVAYFLRWMREFPTIEAVACATDDSLLKAWEGLGYYRRVRQMQQAARAIVNQHGGKFPENLTDLRALPGVGAYTAAALVSIAFNQDVLCVDANVERVFSRLYNISGSIRRADNAALLRQKAQEMLPAGQARTFSQALMELGALVCTKNPQCGLCPFAAHCQAHALGLETERPELPPRKKSIPLHVSCAVFLHDGHILIHKRPDKGLWAGLWEFPFVDAKDQPAWNALTAHLKKLDLEGQQAHEFAEKRHSYTCYRVRLHAFLVKSVRCKPDRFPSPDWLWVTPDCLEQYTFSAGQRRLLADITALGL